MATKSGGGAKRTQPANVDATLVQAVVTRLGMEVPEPVPAVVPADDVEEAMQSEATTEVDG